MYMVEIKILFIETPMEPTKETIISGYSTGCERIE